jgi:hypothetical protein
MVVRRIVLHLQLSARSCRSRSGHAYSGVVHKSRIRMVKKRKSPGEPSTLFALPISGPREQIDAEVLQASGLRSASTRTQCPTGSHDPRNKADTLTTTTHPHIKLTQPPEISRKVTVINRDAAPRPIVAEGKSVRRRSHRPLVVG